MFITKWQTDQGLWQSALTLVRSRHYTDAAEVIKAIAAQTVQSIGGTISFQSFPTPTKKLEEEEVLYMQALSKEIAQLAEERKKDKVAELTTEYLDRFVHLLSETKRDSDYLHRELLKGLIEFKLTSQEKHFKLVKTVKTFDKSTLPKTVSVEFEKAGYVTPSEAAVIGGVSDQTIRRWCEKGKFPEAFKTDGGHWRIPQKYFKMSIEQAREADAFMKKADEETRDQLGGDVDEFDLDLDYS
ncbi:helix-turn-helix domain-containing protein [Rossellomorea vietnamensis]|uniref:Helix-turn-helix domain-containing protein n=1 Tax=Rossellomorea vietnamensis TaxID=218284 RepID=A0A5D4NV23_9BACI|nr:helix-turn-helix domain-containing protein [Rossellomorea vietnamensis]TYS17719.1 helix-turn-helix domain-containing protein [Rossellomorea vietnamensis]